MEKAYKYRIYPNKKQQELIQKTFGCCRFVYNYYLDKHKEAFEKEGITLHFVDYSKDLTKLKQQYEWLKEPDKYALQNALKNLESAYDNYFKRSYNYPKFKSKKSHKFSYKTQYAFGSTQSKPTIEVVNRHIKLPKLGWIKTKNRMMPQGRILNAIISQDCSGKYYCSIVCKEVPIEPLPKTGREVGIDLGFTHYAITSDGVKYSNPRYLRKSMDKLKRLHRELSRKSRGGSNYNKARIRFARLHQKVVNQKIDFIHKLTTELVRNYDTICIETIVVEDLQKNKMVALSLVDGTWYRFSKQLEYKCQWYGKQLIKVGKRYPSSQICSCCGERNQDVKDLTIRKWICPKCKNEVDRDINSAKNILHEGKRLLSA